MSQPTLEERRLAFDAELRALLSPTAENWQWSPFNFESGVIPEPPDINTYYEPPANVRMSYPCVVYSRGNIDDVRADDMHYTRRLRFMVTTISNNPDSEWPQMILDHFPYSRFDRSYNADGLNHNVMMIYY